MMIGNDETDEELERFQTYLRQEERSRETIEKYLREAKRFLEFSKGRKIDQDLAIAYKELLIAKGYTSAGINAMLAGVRALLLFMGFKDIHIRNLKVQKKAYLNEERILRRDEYKRLLKAAKEKDEEMELILETIASTGIRISELVFFTRKEIEKAEITIRLKGKERSILIPEKLRKRLVRYALSQGIEEGPVFVNHRKAPLHRSCIWARMKALAKRAGVKATKVFPHNLRKLFARTYYKVWHDIAGLADMLGHSSVDTTRIYIRESRAVQLRALEGLGMLL